MLTKFILQIKSLNSCGFYFLFILLPMIFWLPTWILLGLIVFSSSSGAKAMVCQRVESDEINCQLVELGFDRVGLSLINNLQKAELLQFIERSGDYTSEVILSSSGGDTTFIYNRYSKKQAMRHSYRSRSEKIVLSQINSFIKNKNQPFFFIQTKWSSYIVWLTVGLLPIILILEAIRRFLKL